MPVDDFGLNFRSTAGYVTDSGTNVYAVEADDTGGDITRGGYTFSLDFGGAMSDRSASVDSRLAGFAYRANTTGPALARVKIVLNGTGDKIIRLALGDAISAQGQQYLRIFDGDPGANGLGAGVLKATINVASVASGQWVDATGTVRTSAANWANFNQSITLNFSGNELWLAVGRASAGAEDYTVLSHIHVTDGTAGPVLSSVTPSSGNHNHTYTAVALVGTGFVIGATTVNVPSGWSVANTSVSSTTNLTCDITTGAGSSLGTTAGAISVTTANGTSGNQTFTLAQVPAITSISPNNQDPATGPTTITVTGTGFSSGGLAFSLSPSTDMTIASTHFTSATQAEFSLTTGVSAAFGNRLLSLTQTSGGLSNSVTLRINGTSSSGGAGSGISLNNSAGIQFV